MSTENFETLNEFLAAEGKRDPAFAAAFARAKRPTPACDALPEPSRSFARFLAHRPYTDTRWLSARVNDPIADTGDCEALRISSGEWYAAHRAALADLTAPLPKVDPYAEARLEVQRLELARKAPVSDRERADILRRCKDAALVLDPQQPFSGRIEWTAKAMPMVEGRPAKAGETPTHFLPVCDARIHAPGRYNTADAAQAQARTLALTLDARTKRMP